jgi:uncharacterized protein YqfA (UPF0365 family)
MSKIQRIAVQDDQGREYINYSRKAFSKSRSRSVRKKKGGKHDEDPGDRDFTAHKSDYASNRETTAQKMARKEKERQAKLEELKESVVFAETARPRAQKCAQRQADHHQIRAQTTQDPAAQAHKRQKILARG